MSSHLREVLDRVELITGWNTESKLEVALDYIANQQSDDAFEEYVAERVAQEKAMGE